jgi:hypothetical protein
MSTDFRRVRDEFGFLGDDRVIAKRFLLWAAIVGAISILRRPDPVTGRCAKAAIMPEQVN